MGIFHVTATMSNMFNSYLPLEAHGADITCEILVDTGAAELAIPVELGQQLKLKHLDDVRVFTADGGIHEYRVLGMIELSVQGRKCHVRAIELPHGAEPLLGAVPLEEMDWHVSPLEKKLLPNPKSLNRPLLPLC